ncbi:MAG: Crp/Fnr family transcriptional regulator [Flavobacteriales bacterium]|nr:Crp/Fnr family transcriptional regulator [Flavobacteriales bacterium]
MKKKEMFSSEGKVATKMAFIEDGAFHYYYDNDGDLITTFISLEYNLITSISSFISGMPSTENIQAITDSTIAVISKESINQLRKDIPRFQVFYIEAIERQVVCLDTSRLELLTLTSEQRYLRLLELHPQILQRIPLKLLATTLGMTTRHLTRIRKSIIQ